MPLFATTPMTTEETVDPLTSSECGLRLSTNPIRWPTGRLGGN